MVRRSSPNSIGQRAAHVSRVVGRDGTARVLFERSSEDAYANPGSPYSAPGRDTVLTHQGAIYLLGQGASPEGDRPFADRLDLATGKATRLFRSSGEQFEQVVAVVSPDGSRLLTRHESKTSPPNYVLRVLPAPGNRESGVGSRVALTAFADPAPQMRGVTKELVELHAQGRRRADRHALPAAGLHAGHATCRC